MWKARRTWVHTLTIGILALLLLGGCVTQQQVKAMVAESNAAMVTPSPDIPGGEQEASWKEAVTRIDRLIASNPDQPVLVNHLRVRQAMLLTVNRHDSLAEACWRRIDGSALRTERDAALLEHHACLVWWYKRASDPSPLDSQERPRAEGFIRDLSESIDGLETRSVRIYLGTIRVQMELSLLNRARINTQERRRAEVQGLEDALEAYAALFSEAHTQWVREHWETDLLPEGMTVTDLRHASWLRRMIRKFKRLAERRTLEVVWRPAWIGELPG
ncbi:MAG: hypothetical protein ACQET1_07830 [Gemmatimonadota bacterium]